MALFNPLDSYAALDAAWACRAKVISYLPRSARVDGQGPAAGARGGHHRRAGTVHPERSGHPGTGHKSREHPQPAINLGFFSLPGMLSQLFQQSIIVHCGMFSVRWGRDPSRGRRADRGKAVRKNSHNVCNALSARARSMFDTPMRGGSVSILCDRNGAVFSGGRCSGGADGSHTQISLGGRDGVRPAAQFSDWALRTKDSIRSMKTDFVLAVGSPATARAGLKGLRHRRRELEV